MHIMARQQRAQSVRAFTPPAAAQFGAQVFVFVGTDAHTSPRLEETDLIRKLGCHSQGRLASSGGRVLVCCARPLRLRQKSTLLAARQVTFAEWACVASMSHGDAAISGMPENSGKQTRTNGNMTRHEIGRPRCGRNGTFSLIFRTVGAGGGGSSRTNIDFIDALAKCDTSGSIKRQRESSAAVAPVL